MSQPISCVPFWNPERQITVSTSLRIVGACAGITLTVIAILSLCNVSPLSQISMPGPWIMLSCGVVSLLLSGSIKCINKRIIPSAKELLDQQFRVATKFSEALSSEMVTFEENHRVQFRKVFIDIIDKASQVNVMSEELSNIVVCSYEEQLTAKAWKAYLNAAMTTLPWTGPNMKVIVSLIIQDTQGEIHFFQTCTDSEKFLPLVSNNEELPPVPNNEQRDPIWYDQVSLKETSLICAYDRLRELNPGREVSRI